MSKLIAYEENGNVIISSFSDENAVIDFEHIALSTVPIEPNECLYIENGEIKIDQQKLIEYNRKNMPTLTPIEFDIKLVDVGLYDQVHVLISKDIKLRIAYARATFFSRTSSFIDQTRIALNLTDEQVDEMWTS